MPGTAGSRRRQSPGKSGEVPGDWIFGASAFGRRGGTALPASRNNTAVLLDVRSLKGLLPSRLGGSLDSRTRTAAQPTSFGDIEKMLTPNVRQYMLRAHTAAPQQSAQQSAQEPSSTPRTAAAAAATTMALLTAPSTAAELEDYENQHQRESRLAAVHRHRERTHTADERARIAEMLGLASEDWDQVVELLQGVWATHGMREAELYGEVLARYAGPEGLIEVQQLRTALSELEDDLEDSDLRAVVAQASGLATARRVDYRTVLLLLLSRKRRVDVAHRLGRTAAPAGMRQLSSLHRVPDLPPLKLLSRPPKHNPFDPHYSRETPHALRVGTEASILDLRRELAVSEHGVSVLNGKVRKHVQWVKNNCPVTSHKAQLFCKRWAAERLSRVLLRMRLALMVAATQRWKDCVVFSRNQRVAQHYLHYEGVQKLTALLRTWHRGRYLKAWNSWLFQTLRSKAEEREAAASIMQSVARVKLARNRVLAVVRGNAAVHVQRIVRGFLGRRRAAAARLERLRQQSAVLIQRNYRGYAGRRLARRVAHLKRVTAAAIRIQRVGRGHMSRQRVRRIRLERLRNKSATDVQRVWRGVRARRRVAAIREFRRRTRAATRIQAAYRGMHGRRKAKQVRRRRDAARCLQCWYRAFLVARRILARKHYRAATRIQSAWRGKMARDALRERLLEHRRQLAILREIQRGAATIIQAAWRGHLARQYVLTLKLELERERAREAAAERLRLENASATDIQRLWKGYRARVMTAMRREALAVIAENERVAATAIQALVRRFLAKCELLRRREAKRIAMEEAALKHQRAREQAAIKIQCAQRGVEGRRRSSVMRQAAEEEALASIRIQSAFRGAVGRRNSAVLLAEQLERMERERREKEDADRAAAEGKSATLIQAVARGGRARRRSSLIRDQRRASAVRIQAMLRGERARRSSVVMREERAVALAQVDLSTMEAAAIRLQSQWRVFSARKRVRERREAAEALRLDNERADQQAAAVKIQNLARRREARQKYAKRKAEHERRLRSLQASGEMAADEMEALRIEQELELEEMRRKADVEKARTEAQMKQLAREHEEREEKRLVLQAQQARAVQQQHATVMRHGASRAKARDNELESRRAALDRELAAERKRQEELSALQAQLLAEGDEDGAGAVRLEALMKGQTDKRVIDSLEDEIHTREMRQMAAEVQRADTAHETRLRLLQLNAKQTLGDGHEQALEMERQQQALLEQQHQLMEAENDHAERLRRLQAEQERSRLALEEQTRRQEAEFEEMQRRLEEEAEAQAEAARQRAAELERRRQEALAQRAQEKAEQQAAIKLQALMRGRKGRQRMLDRKKQLEIELKAVEEREAKDREIRLRAAAEASAKAAADLAAAQAAAEAQEAAEGTVDDEWTEFVDPTTNAIYYFNQRTHEASWTKPGANYDSEAGYDTTGTVTDVESDNHDYQWSADYTACEDCGGYAACRCQECAAPFCQGCFDAIHARGARAGHTQLELFPQRKSRRPICSECEVDTSTKRCLVCDDVFCETCYAAQHSKGRSTTHEWEPTLPPVCANCETEDSTVKCTSCLETLCKECAAETHRKGKKQNHEMEDIIVEGLDAEEDAAGAAGAGAADGWSEAILDEGSGAYYYYNEVTGETMWA